MLESWLSPVISWLGLPLGYCLALVAILLLAIIAIKK